MAIEYNYDGPPSLEIYQDFVRTSTTDADSQSVVVVAEHYDVVKKDYNPDEIAPKAYNMDKGVTFEWDTDLKTSESLVDKDSIKAVMSNVYTNKKIITTGTYTKTDGNQIKIGVDDSLDKVYVGDIVAINTGVGKNTIAKIISMGSSDDEYAPVVTSHDTNANANLLQVGGKYTGSTTRTYYIKVISINEAGSSSEDSSSSDGSAIGVDYVNVVITTADGTDGAKACAVPVSTDANNVVALANSGLTIRFTSKAISSDVYFQVDVGAKGAKKDLINLDTTIKATEGSTVEDIMIGGLSSDIVIDSDVITVGSDVAIPPTIKDTDGKLIMAGDVFVEYRALSTEFYNQLKTIAIEDGVSLNKLVGYTGVENPLGAMVSVALKGGASLYCTSVKADTAAEYQRAFSFLSRSTNTYAIVIGSLRADVIGNLATFLKACADPKVANYKIGYYGLDSTSDVVIWEGNRATLTGNTVTCKDGGFLTKGVRAGDVINMVIGQTDAGKPNYKAFVVESVTSDTEATIKNSSDITQPVPVVFNVSRTLTGGELVDALKNRVYNNNHRCYCVFGDGITVDGIEDAPAWLLAALPAGMRAAEYVQRPISNLAYDGCRAVNKLNLSASEMRDLASRGVWILANDTTGDVVYNYHQLSTDMSDKKYQEQSYTTNYDNISRSVRSLLAPYYGNSNISQDLFRQILADITSLLDLKVMKSPSVNIGPQLISYSNLRLEQDPVHRDHVYMYVDYQMPAPFNHVVAKQRLI